MGKAMVFLSKAYRERCRKVADRWVGSRSQDHRIVLMDQYDQILAVDPSMKCTMAYCCCGCEW